jgi:hypothetical protein
MNASVSTIGGAIVRSSPVVIFSLLTKLTVLLCFAVLLSLDVSLKGQESILSKPASQWTEEDALTVLNDSPWAQTVTTSVQERACGYKNPAFPNQLTEHEAESSEIISPTPPSVEVKPDGAEYLIRWISAKPVQEAVQRLVGTDEKWHSYGWSYQENDGANAPTDPSRPYYNRNDMITISVILKKLGPNGESFRDYAFFDGGNKFPAKGIRLSPCAALKTSNGIATAHLAGLGATPTRPTITLSFPSRVAGKALVSHKNEKVQFRFIANQRVFETVFTIDVKDLPDGTEPRLYYPSETTDLKRASSAANQ